MSTAGKLLLVATVVLLGAHEAARAAESAAMLPVAVQDIRVTDTFWAPRMKVVGKNMIPHSWKYVESAVQELKYAGKVEAVKPEPEHRGRVKWREANLHKLLETCAYALAQQKDPKLDAKASGPTTFFRTPATPNRARPAGW